MTALLLCAVGAIVAGALVAALLTPRFGMLRAAAIVPLLVLAGGGLIASIAKLQPADPRNDYADLAIAATMLLALVGALLAFGGGLLAAWGRQRSSRSR